VEARPLWKHALCGSTPSVEARPLSKPSALIRMLCMNAVPLTASGMLGTAHASTLPDYRYVVTSSQELEPLPRAQAMQRLGSLQVQAMRQWVLLVMQPLAPRQSAHCMLRCPQIL